MLVASFDIGIKNLAYCILSYSPYDAINYPITTWDIINLLDQDKYATCCKCDRDSYYKLGTDGSGGSGGSSGSTYCKVHLRSPEMIEKCTRTYTVENIQTFELATQLIKKLDQIDFSDCDAIIMEQQPDKRRDMMNLSMMLMNYFIMKYVVGGNDSKIKVVDFISSQNKLKVYDGPYIECKLKSQYSRNKFYGKAFCKYLIRNDSENTALFNSHKKADDLADSFLQGAWYLITNYKDTGKLKPKPLVTKVSPTVDVPKITLKLKPHIELKDKTKLDAIQQSDTHKHIMHDMYLNKYKHLRFGRKPKVNQMKYTLAELKYINEHNVTLTESMKKSFKFYFGSMEILSKQNNFLNDSRK